MAVHTPARDVASPHPAPRPNRKPGAHRQVRLRLFNFEVKFAPYAYIAPFFVLFAAFGLFPLIYTVYLSFTDTRLLRDTNSWVGFQNYVYLFTDAVGSDRFFNSLWRTFTIGVISTVPQLLMALGLAHLLNYSMRVRNFFRISMIIPYATSLVAATMVFGLLFSERSDGFANALLGHLGFGLVPWRNGVWWSQIAVSVIVTWHWTGYNALIYLAGMQSIGKELYESASMDGANRFKQFLHVTIPGLRPTIIFTIVLSTIGATQLFTEPYLFYGNAGGGGVHQGQTLVLYMYQQAFTNRNLGRASAIACVTLVLIVLLVLINTGVASLRGRQSKVRANPAVVPMGPTAVLPGAPQGRSDSR